MQYVVCYDIADDRRRDRIAAALLDFGPRVQESVFVANLDAELAARMEERLRRLADENFDKVHVFALCEACAARTKVMGTGEVARDPAYYLV